MPLNVTKDKLVDLILGHQARVLTERAQLAIRQVLTDPVDILAVDASTLQPPSTAYSSGGNQLYQPPTGSSTRQTASAGIRSRVRQQMALRKVCVCERESVCVKELQERERERCLFCREHFCVAV